MTGFIPLALTIEDFMNHKYSYIDCSSFGSALIAAKNRESNGIGKTTIYSAIEFVLFGEVPTATIDKVVRDGAERCLVTLDFTISGEKYRAIRGRSAKGRSELKLYEFKGDKFEPITQRGVNDSSKELVRLIKINHKSFSHSIKFGQADFGGMAAVDSEKRKAILKEPLSLTEYTKLEKIGVDKIRPLKKDAERIENTIQTLGDPDSDTKASSAELQVCDSTIKARLATIDKLSVSIVEKQSALDDVKKSLSSSDSDIHDKISGLNRRAKELRLLIDKSNEGIQDSDKTIGENKTKCGQLQSVLNDCERSYQDLLMKQIREKSIVQAELDKVISDELVGNKKLTKLEVEYDHLNKSLPNGNVCPSCFQEITAEHRKKCEEDVAKSLAEKSEKIVTTKTNLVKCFNKKKKLKKELDDAGEYERAVKDTKQKIDSSKSEIDIRTKHIKDAESRLSTSVNSMQTSQAELNELTANLDGLKELAQKSSVADVNKKIFTISDEIKVYERSLQNVRNELSSAQVRQGAAQEKLKKANENSAKLVELKKEIAGIRKNIKIYQMGINGFSPSGIPSFIINTILDEYQIESNLWLSKLRPELTLEFDKDVNIFYRVNTKLRDYDQLSIGQKVYVIIGLKLGLLTVIKKKLGIDIRFLLFDEVEAYLDEPGVEAYCEALKMLEKEFKLFIISHNQIVKEKFSNFIEISGDCESGAMASVLAA